MKKPSVSILTIVKYDQLNLLKILADSLKEQYYDNILEWIIIKTFNDHILLDTEINTIYHNVELKSIGSIKNYANSKALGDIIIWASVDDYQFPSRINTIVQRLLNSEKMLTGSQNIYLYRETPLFINQLDKSLNPNQKYIININYSKCWDTFLCSK